MKLFIVILALGISANACYAQQGAKQNNGVNTANGIQNNNDAIINKLTSSLQLTAQQKQSVSASINDFLAKKARLQPAAVNNKAAADAKTGTLRENMMNKIKGAITEEQYNKLLQMKPQEGDKSNPLSAIF